jgi:hypothetical protein
VVRAVWLDRRLVFRSDRFRSRLAVQIVEDLEERFSEEAMQTMVRLIASCIKESPQPQAEFKPMSAVFQTAEPDDDESQWDFETPEEELVDGPSYGDQNGDLGAEEDDDDE